jgi:hypothetical protein
MKTIGWWLGSLGVVLVLGAPTVLERAEVWRIQAHLAGAERLLRSTSTDALNPQQRLARARNIELLRAYRLRGVFPHNTGHPGRRVPYFVDNRGVHCAVGYLIACSGREGLVARIHETRNNARIRDLAGDPALVAWLHDAGLTLAEAARIQPAYGYEPETDVVSSDYAATTAIASLASGGLIALNVTGSGRAEGRGYLGMAVGGLTVALGAAKLDESGDARAFGVWNTVIGATTLVLGATRAFGREHPKTSAAIAPDRPSFAVAPILGPAPGLKLALSF